MTDRLEIDACGEPVELDDDDGEWIVHPAEHDGSRNVQRAEDAPR
jgi:hypothetical protein